MKEITVEMIRELANDQELAKEISKAKTAQEMQRVMQNYGVEISVEEIEKGYNEAKELLIQNGCLENGELTETSLDMVAGGIRAGQFLFGTFMAMGVMATGPVGIALWLGGMAVMCTSF